MSKRQDEIEAQTSELSKRLARLIDLLTSVPLRPAEAAAS
jgi:hypothetical protein